MIGKAKKYGKRDKNAIVDWLWDYLKTIPPEQIENFHIIMRAYIELADKPGLRIASDIMAGSCSDWIFRDFRAWVIAQGKSVYLAALKDPDTLAKVRPFGECIFERLNYTAAGVYEEITGQDIDDMKNAYQYRIIKAKLQRDIEYGEGINIQKEWQEYPLVVPKLYKKYMELEKRYEDAPDLLRFTDNVCLSVKSMPVSIKKGKKLEDGRER